MKKWLPFIIYWLIPTFIAGQYNLSGFCENTPGWDKIVIPKNKIPEGFARLFIITNRPFIPNAENKEIFPNDIADYRRVSYIVAACDGKQWYFSFVNSFAEGMQAINDGRDILLFIEGHGKTLPMALNRAYQVQARYDVSLILFDWPSKNSDFNLSLARVRRCTDNFYNLLLQIRDYKKQYLHANQHFSILAHSLGNYFLSYLVVCGDAQYLQNPFIDNIIMNAPAIRTKEHGEVLSQLKFHHRLFIMMNKNDWVLKGANLLTSGKMLGNMAMKPLVDSAIYVDFTPVAGREHSYYFGYHSFEYTNPAFYYLYYNAVHGHVVNMHDEKMFVSGNTQNVFYIKN
jgi:hypothetical protein